MTGCRFCFQLVKMSEPYSIVFLPNYGVCLSSPISLIIVTSSCYMVIVPYTREMLLFFPRAVRYRFVLLRFLKYVGSRSASSILYSNVPRLYTID